jgi:hypothetical protein
MRQPENSTPLNRVFNLENKKGKPVLDQGSRVDGITQRFLTVLNSTLERKAAALV